MGDDIQGSEDRILRPGAVAVLLQVEVTICSAADANDGMLPYETNVSSVTITSYKYVDSGANTLVTDLINGTHTYSVASNIISIYLDYPGTSGEGLYELKVLPVLDNSKTTESFLVQNIKAVNEQA